MIDFFKYNWMVREEWFSLCSQLSENELVQERQGGLGSILKTFFHIVDVECSWIQAINGDVVSEPNYEHYKSLELIRELSRESQDVVNKSLLNWTPKNEYKSVSVPWSSKTYYYGEVLRHVIVHEIHHIGQLSIWSNAMGLKAVNVNYIGRGFMDNDKRIIEGRDII
ncbi:DinB family protein [Paenibacillus sp. M1]|uniref:DinB family protein n=1 Tax=Paenibacillus haidiansis TaxID=1574488 RepID=A0ABU7VSP4_9BACL